jgi:hypothetical protein
MRKLGAGLAVQPDQQWLGQRGQQQLQLIALEAVGVGAPSG